jgi:hypothetical protein
MQLDMKRKIRGLFYEIKAPYKFVEISPSGYSLQGLFELDKGKHH